MASGAWYPTVFPDKCDGCKNLEKPRCVEYCPNDVFKIIHEKSVVANPHKCVYGCTACQPVCPRKAIAFPQRIETMTRTKQKKEGLLRKTKCKKCGKIFWTNRDTDLCFDCER